MAALRARLGGFAFGGDYNPEQWDSAVWREDVDLMRRAGVTLVTLSVFAWVMDLLDANGTRVLASYASGLLAGRPAVVENRLGAGRVLYVGTRLAETALRDIVLGAVREAGVARLVDDAPSFVEAARRGNERGEYLFLLNHSDTGAATVSLAGTGEDLLSGSAVKERLTLPPLAVAVIRLDPSQ